MNALSLLEFRIKVVVLREQRKIPSGERVEREREREREKHAFGKHYSACMHAFPIHAYYMHSHVLF